jgi:hypothetical protein
VNRVRKTHSLGFLCTILMLLHLGRICDVGEISLQSCASSLQ